MWHNLHWWKTLSHGYITYLCSVANHTLFEIGGYHNRRLQVIIELLTQLCCTVVSWNLSGWIELFHLPCKSIFVSKLLFKTAVVYVLGQCLYLMNMWNHVCLQTEPVLLSRAWFPSIRQMSMKERTIIIKILKVTSWRLRRRGMGALSTHFS